MNGCVNPAAIAAPVVVGFVLLVFVVIVALLFRKKYKTQTRRLKREYEMQSILNKLALKDVDMGDGMCIIFRHVTSTDDRG